MKKYTKTHEWLEIKDGVAYVGISRHAAQELGEIVFVEVETVGETLSAGAVFGTVEAVKTVSDLNMPVSGEVLEFNENLNDHPEAVNQDPYGEGWMIKISVPNPAELDALLDAEGYKAII